MTKTTKPQIVQILKGSSRPAHKRVSTVTPIASSFACKLSEMLRRVPLQRRDKMIQQLVVAGVTQVDGWSLKDLSIGRINPDTGDRILPNGQIARDTRGGSGSDGRYYGSCPQAPITSCTQMGVVWSPGS
jgi:hypothetical protein